MKEIAFNCSQTEKHGFGHFFRCLNLAKHISNKMNCNITFFGEFSPFALKVLNKLSFTNIISDSPLPIGLNIKDYDILITDRYDINQSYLDLLADKKEIKKIFIDDFNVLDFTNQDLIINFRVGASEFNYTSKDYALGPEYFIYTPVLSEIRLNYKFRNNIKSVLIYGTSTNQSNSLFLDIPKYLIGNYNDIEVVHLTDKVIDFHHNRYRAISLTNNIEKHFETADIIINGGGLIKYEAAFCGIPSATLSTTEEQHEDTILLQKENLLYNLGCQMDITTIDLEKKLNYFIEDSSLRELIHKKGRKIFTPKSISNLINKINEV